MIRYATEGNLTWFKDLNVSDVPHPLPSGISIHVKRGEIGLEVSGVAGVIRFLNGDTLQITPKIGKVNFLRLLFKAQGSQQNLLEEYNDFVMYSLDNEQSIDSLAARQLFMSAAEILSRSPKQGRIKRKQRGMFAIGQLDTLATAFNVACHKEAPVTYLLKEKTTDIAENRVITEAIIRGWPILKDDYRNSLRWIYEQWVSKFKKSKDLNQDLEHIEQGFASGRYGGPRDYYRKTLMLSQIILGSNGFGFSEAEKIEGEAILLNTADVFEKYLRNIISTAYSGDGYLISKGSTGANSLYIDGSFVLQPDIIISKGGRILLICDAKYKKPTAADHYQMHTYLQINGVKQGLLLAPLFEGNKIEIHEYSTVDKTVIKEVLLPMSDLAVTEEFLSALVSRFL